MPNISRGTAQCSYDKGDTYGNVAPSYDVAIANVPYSDGITGAGDKFEVEYTSSSLLISFSAGSIAKVGGAFWVLKSGASITLQGNQEQYVCLTIDKGQQDGSKADITLKTQSQIQKGILYGSGSIRDLPIYKITTNASGVASIVDLRKITKENYLLTETEMESTTPDSETRYEVRED
ncbi:MAG: hypothetical protein KBT03_11485 [Bacteroidales bacterium]|nr:hypothetical protein [Candidatus Scybalousia scybalohippi]